MHYIVDRDGRGTARELKYMSLPGVVRYEYASDKDRIGRIGKPE